jgi:AcrR family transcriptional regulator
VPRALGPPILGGPRPEGRREEIVAAAAAILETEGEAALTMRRLGERVGMRAPSLYKHLPDKATLEAALAERTLAAMGEALADASDLASLGAAYRRFALANPAAYRLATDRPLPRDRLPEGLEDAVAAHVVELAGGPDRGRAVWAFAHGMVSLELAGRFPAGADLDAAWAAGLAAFA